MYKQWTPLLAALWLSAALVGQTTVQPLIDYFAVDFNAPDGVADSTNGSSVNLVVGRLDNGNLARGIVVFELPEINVEEIVSVTLELDFAVDNLTSETISADLYHSVSFNALVPSIFSMYGDPSNPPDSFSIAVNNAVTDTTAPGLLSIDVTSQVVADLAGEGSEAVSVFRLQLDSEAVESGQRLVFAQSENENFSTPTLTITLVGDVIGSDWEPGWQEDPELGWIYNYADSGWSYSDTLQNWFERSSYPWVYVPKL